MAASIGSRLAPARFLLFVAVAAGGGALGTRLLGWREGIMAGFDLAAMLFLLVCLPLLDDKPDEMRAAAAGNDANRATLLGLSLAVIAVLLVAIGAELAQKDTPDAWSVTLVIATLVLAWLFGNSIYALHYAHLFYLPADDGSGDSGGLDFPDTDEPDYFDFVYFAFTLGMTFQTSDVEMRARGFRRVATLHGFAAFVFNIGVLAFTINVLGG